MPGMSTVIFAAIGISGYLTFGKDVKADVLVNYTPSALEPLFGQPWASMLSNALNVGYFCLLVCTYPLLNWPFRENVLELIGKSSQAMSTYCFYIVSAILLSVVYGIAMVIELPRYLQTIQFASRPALTTFHVVQAVPNIWVALSLMGSTSAVL
eukprot:scaffold675839_cov66-Prasinocladus_malaysianus.AAC.1